MNVKLNRCCFLSSRSEKSSSPGTWGWGGREGIQNGLRRQKAQGDFTSILRFCSSVWSGGIITILACLPPNSEQVCSWSFASTSKPTAGKEVGRQETHITPHSSPSTSGQTHSPSSSSFLPGPPPKWSPQRHLHWLSPHRAPSFTLCPAPAFFFFLVLSTA